MEQRIITDTSNFFSIDYGDIILIDNEKYKVTGHERERRFGVTDPKFWVKRAVDLKTDEKKIIKLSFFESFETKMGGVPITCFRSPDKEGKILELVKDHPGFMRGTVHRDIKGNNMRLIEPVRGPNFFIYIGSMDMDHKIYFNEILPGVLKKIVKAFEGIRFLHANGYKHGDIRNDHIIVEESSGNYVWIDFDYDFSTSENPWSLDIFGMGNILLNAVGKGFHNLDMIRDNKRIYGDLIDNLDKNDFSIFNKRRLMNLKKLYDYIPVPLNNMLIHFSRGTEIFYETSDEIIEDLNRCLYSFF
ncbi:protein kinase [Thermodesulfobacteriota bacterium]